MFNAGDPDVQMLVGGSSSEFCLHYAWSVIRCPARQVSIITQESTLLSGQAGYGSCNCKTRCWHFVVARRVVTLGTVWYNSVAVVAASLALVANNRRRIVYIHSVRGEERGGDGREGGDRPPHVKILDPPLA